MNKSEYLSDPDVIDFVSWLKQNLETLNFKLNIKSSRFVPGGIDKEVKGISKISKLYRWKAPGTGAGGLKETQSYIKSLSNRLKSSISEGTDQETLDICKDILRWGGNRNFNVGAFPFLNEKSDQSPPSLNSYLRETQRLLTLKNADTDSLDAIERMNAMLTKVHSFASPDGLPIYDSRVAACITTLVEKWRQDGQIARDHTPPTLLFPCTDSSRTPDSAYDNVDRIQIITSSPNYSKLWASAKIRTGWLIQSILDDNNILPEFTDTEERMRVMEACFFLLGYHPSSISGNHFTSLSNNRKIQSMDQESFNNSSYKEAPLLSGRGKPIKYKSNDSGDTLLIWSSYKTLISSEFIEELATEFEGETFPLDATRTKSNLVEDGLGLWLHHNGYPNTTITSALGSLLVAIGIAKHHKKGKAIYLEINRPGSEV